MRALLAKDIAPFTKVLAKMELKDLFKGLFKNKNKGKDEQSDEEKDYSELGTDLIWGIIENYHKAEKEFFVFLAGLEDKTPDEIAELPAADFINLVTELLSETNLPFFKSAAS